MGIRLTIKCEFTNGVLGTAPNNESLFADYVASKAPDAKSMEEEIEALGAGEYTDRQMTVFMRDEDGDPAIRDYQIKGFFKDACNMLKRVPGTKCFSVKAYKKIIDGCFFVYPKFIKFDFDGEIDYKERPLRAQTPQGERTALTSSEMVNEGATVTFDLELLNPADRAMAIECLEYGRRRGFGQWRNAGWGTFEYRILKEEEFAI